MFVHYCTNSRVLDSLFVFYIFLYTNPAVLSMRILKSTWDLVDSVQNRPQINFRKSRWLFRRLGTKKRLAIQTPDWCIWNCFYPILLKIHESAFFIWNHRNTRIEFCETFSFIQPLCNLLLHTSILLNTYCRLLFCRWL